MAYNNKNGIYEAMSLAETNLEVPFPTSTQNDGTQGTHTHTHTLSVVNSQQTPAAFETMDRQSVAGTNTLKRNPKMELSKTDLLRLLSYMEGELQAQNIVIAALKSERLKHEVALGRYKPSALNAPLAALARDCIFEKGSQSINAHQEMSQLADQQFETLDNLVMQQRRMQIRMANILKEAEEKHQRVIHELEDEKRKHEHDTAQGDDITYGLEMERTRLKQELELEKQAKKRHEKDQKKFQESVDDERSRQKQIVLLLLAERKKIIIRYIEERKRSEDLAQILSEEKARIDAMAEGLEEESKKSLRSEAELEKHLQQCEKEKLSLRAKITADELKIKELESELQMYKQMVCSSSSKQVINMTATNEQVNVLPSVGRVSDAAVAMVALETITTGIPSSVAKVMQPTSTVSSVPVSGPTTGIAQTIHSIATAHHLQHQQPQHRVAAAVVATPNKSTTAYPPRLQHANVPPTPPSGVSSPSPSPSTTTSTSTSTSTPHTYLKKNAMINRGVPPPIPPNKPVVPPKRDAGDRKPSISGSSVSSPVVRTSGGGGGSVQKVVNPTTTTTTIITTSSSSTAGVGVNSASGSDPPS